MVQKLLAPVTVRKQPEIFCFTFGMRTARSAMLCRQPDYAAILCGWMQLPGGPRFLVVRVVGIIKDPQGRRARGLVACIV